MVLRRAMLFLLVGALLTGGAYLAATELGQRIERQSPTPDPPARPGTDAPYDRHRWGSIPWDAAPPGFPSFVASLWVLAAVLALLGALAVTVLLQRRAGRRAERDADGQARRAA